MAMIYSFFGNPSIDSKPVLEKYEDSAQISAWAEDAIAWTIENGLLKVDKKYPLNHQLPEKILLMQQARSWLLAELRSL